MRDVLSWLFVSLCIVGVPLSALNWVLVPADAQVIVYLSVVYPAALVTLLWRAARPSAEDKSKPDERTNLPVARLL